MKTAIRLIIASALLTISALCRAQDVPPGPTVDTIPIETIADISLPIESEAALRSFAITEIRQGWIGIGGDTQIWVPESSRNFRYKPTKLGASIKEIQEIFFQKVLKGRFANPKGRVYVN